MEQHVSAQHMETFHYDDAIVRKFAWATITWSIVGMLVGLIIASELVFPSLNIAVKG